MKIKSSVTVLLVILFALSVVYAQESEQNVSRDKTATIEELYLQSGDIMIMREMAFLDDRDMKLMSLTMIEESIKDGSFSTGDPGAHFVLDYLSEEGISRVVRRNNRTVNYFPTVRREACRLLGELGGENSKDTLLNVLRTDDDPVVLAEATYALGVIGLDEEGEVSRAIAFALQNQDQMVPNDNFAHASLLAIQKLIEKNGSTNNRQVYSAVVQIAQNGNYIRPVKEKAYQVISLMREQN
ncbi:HEAT repeat domain-containing protein [Marispirochaeta sp.]|jgi:HEAT repeat protein|uniref:HEAT repeat domain-containing protein n=1 Tax=Marispirochaeta sp. TaxID=2038653 RepID=UPI0029C8D626|nr:HEAT repeat domain-containing protein [Marispirochaeta sp.]